MKTIIEYNPAINVGSDDVLKTDIILVFKKEEPVGYVHFDTNEGVYKLFVNFNTSLDEDFLTEVIIKVNDSYKYLEDLILDYPELQFKIVE